MAHRCGQLEIYPQPPARIAAGAPLIVARVVDATAVVEFVAHPAVPTCGPRLVLNLLGVGLVLRFRSTLRKVAHSESLNRGMRAHEHSEDCRTGLEHRRQRRLRAGNNGQDGGKHAGGRYQATCNDDRCT